MTWRRAVLYWLVALGIFGLRHALIQFSARTPATGAKASAVDPAEFTGLTVESGEIHISATRSGERWHLVGPITQVPGDLLSAIAESLATVGDAQVVSVSGEHPEQYALDPPLMTVSADRTGKPPFRVYLGAPNPAGVAVYGRIDGEAPILLIGLQLRSYLDLLIEAARGDPP